MPALVVPRGRDDREDRAGSGSASSAAASASPVSRSSGVRHDERVDVDDAAACCATDECAWSLTRDAPAGAAVARRASRAAVSRATTSAERLPGRASGHEAAAGLGRAARRGRRASAAPGSRRATAPAASSHEIPCSDDAETTMSNSSAAFVGAAGMNARNRGLSAESTAWARWSSYSLMTVAGSVASGGDEARQQGVQLGRAARMVQRRLGHREPTGDVVQHERASRSSRRCIRAGSVATAASGATTAGSPIPGRHLPARPVHAAGAASGMYPAVAGVSARVRRSGRASQHCEELRAPGRDQSRRPGRARRPARLPADLAICLPRLLHQLGALVRPSDRGQPATTAAAPVSSRSASLLEMSHSPGRRRGFEQVRGARPRIGG